MTDFYPQVNEQGLAEILIALEKHGNPDDYSSFDVWQIVGEVESNAIEEGKAFFLMVKIKNGAPEPIEIEISGVDWHEKVMH